LDQVRAKKNRNNRTIHATLHLPRYSKFIFIAFIIFSDPERLKTPIGTGAIKRGVLNKCVCGASNLDDNECGKFDSRQDATSLKGEEEEEEEELHQAGFNLEQEKEKKKGIIENSEAQGVEFRQKDSSDSDVIPVLIHQNSSNERH